MDRIGSVSFTRFRQSQSLAPAQECGEIWHRDLNTKQGRDAAHEALGLAQWLLVDCAQGEADLDRQVSICPLIAPRRPARCRPQTQGLFADPDRQMPATPKAFIVTCPVSNTILLLRDFVPAVSIEFVRHAQHPEGERVTSVSG